MVINVDEKHCKIQFVTDLPCLSQTIYIQRNPKDVAVSFYKFRCTFKWMHHVSWEEYLEAFMKGYGK